MAPSSGGVLALGPPSGLLLSRDAVSLDLMTGLSTSASLTDLISSYGTMSPPLPSPGATVALQLPSLPMSWDGSSSPSLRRSVSLTGISSLPLLRPSVRLSGRQRRLAPSKNGCICSSLSTRLPDRAFFYLPSLLVPSITGVWVDLPGPENLALPVSFATLVASFPLSH